MERSEKQDYDCFQGGGVEGRSDSLNLTEEGIVGPYHFQSCQMSPFHIIELLLVCLQLYQSDVIQLNSLPSWNK